MFNLQFLKMLHRISPKWVWSLYAHKTKYFFNQSYLILSFDCDTDEDMTVAWEVHAKLQNIGITPVYAIPGALLKKGEKIYKKIFETGAEFINHGGREHTYFDTKHHRHTSCFFYNQQSFEILREDVFLGHQTLQDVLGITPKGWRTPHFGTFQKPEQLNFLYSVLQEMNYRFSSSTIPEMAYQNGPMYKKNGIVEIPVTGIYSEPFNIMDTWAYFAAPDRMKMPHDYLKTTEKLSQFASQNPLLINIYADPSHIHNQPEFFEAMHILSKMTENINYTQLLEITHENIRAV